MEDAHSTLLQLPCQLTMKDIENITDPDTLNALTNLIQTNNNNNNNNQIFSFFGVYDGHGGRSVSKYAGNKLHLRLIADEAFKSVNYRIAIKSAFLGLDSEIRQGK